MTSVRLVYIFVVIIAATLHSSGVAVSAMKNSDTALIGNANTGFDSGVQRRLRGAAKEDLANEERGAPGGTSTELFEKIKDFFTNSNVKERSKALTQKMLKKAKAIYKKHRQNPPLQYMVRN